MNYLDLSHVEVKTLAASQKGQDSLLYYIFEHIITPTNKFCVEFGAVDGYINSNTLFFEQRGWKRLLFDNKYHNPRINLFQAHLTASNICHLFDQHDTPKSLDLLSIDVDGNDYWLLKALLQKYTPKVIMVETNIRFEPDESMVQDYQESFEWNGKAWYGASPLAIKKLAKNYMVAHIHLDDMILVHKDYINDKSLQEKELKVLYKKNTELYKSHNGPDTHGDNWINV